MVMMAVEVAGKEMKDNEMQEIEAMITMAAEAAVMHGKMMCGMIKIKILVMMDIKETYKVSMNLIKIFQGTCQMKSLTKKWRLMLR